MAVNKPVGDNARKGAVKKRTQRKTKVMGATTWMYPEASVTTERAVELVRALRASSRQTYADYLAKVATFPAHPASGTSWPRDGFALPTEDVFMSELARRSSPSTLLGLLDPSAPLVEAPAPLPGS